MKYILLLSMIYWNACYGQRKKDTIQCLMLMCDTSSYRGNKVNGLGQVFWRNGYSVREIHNEQEDTIDWYFDHQRPPEDYGIHLYYLDKNKQKIAPNIVIWQSIEVNQK